MIHTAICWRVGKLWKKQKTKLPFCNSCNISLSNWEANWWYAMGIGHNLHSRLYVDDVYNKWYLKLWWNNSEWCEFLVWAFFEHHVINNNYTATRGNRIWLNFLTFPLKKHSEQYERFGGIKRGWLKIEKSRDECAGLPEGKTASSRNVLASVSDQAALFKKKKKERKSGFLSLKCSQFRKTMEPETETENDKVSVKELHRSQSLHAVCQVFSHH